MIDEINNYSPEMRRIIGLGVHETVHQFFTWAIDHGYYQDETEDFGSENIHNYWGICISNIAGFAKKEKCIEGFLKYVYENNGDFDLFSDPCAKRIGDSTMNYILAARDAGVLPIYSEREISDAHGNTYRIDQTWKHHISDLKVDFSFDGTIPTAKRVKDRQQMEKYVGFNEAARG